jgi:biopolymer transport protein TolQ
MNPADAMGAMPAHDLSIWGLFWSAHPVVKLVMIGLVVASVWCWAIIVDKTLLFRRTKAEMDRFEEAFWSGQSLEELYRANAENPGSGLAAVFVAAMREWKRSFESAGRQVGGLSARIDKCSTSRSSERWSGSIRASCFLHRSDRPVPISASSARCGAS